MFGVCRYVVGGSGKKSVPGAGPKLIAAGPPVWRAVQLPAIEARWCAVVRMLCRKSAAWLKPLAIRTVIIPPRLVSAAANGHGGGRSVLPFRAVRVRSGTLTPPAKSEPALGATTR